MEIISWNVNGIRAACEKGFLDWLEQRKPDILCIQEIKADRKDIPPQLKQIPDLEELGGYTPHWNPSKLKGQRGVGVLTKEEPGKVERELISGKFGEDGRVLKLDFPRFMLLNLYIPHGKRDKSEIPKKLEMYEDLFKFLDKQEKDMILCGDFNVAHTDLDLKRPDQNRNNTMFTQKEREQIGRLTDKGYVDTFRHLNPEEKKYSWWPYSKDARKKNIGWRIDYVFISDSLTENLKDGFILNNIKASDHCPVGINIEF